MGARFWRPAHRAIMKVERASPLAIWRGSQRYPAGVDGAPAIKRPGGQKSLVLGLVAIALAGLPVRGLLAEGADDPDALAEEAVRVNPGLESLEAQVEALRNSARAARRFMDPMLALEYSNVPWDTWRLNDSPMSGLQVKVQQTLPLPGKNQRREAVVLQDVEVKQWTLEEQKLQLRGAVERNYWLLALTRQLQTITRKHVALAESLSGSARAKYQVGAVGQQDLLRLQVLIGKLTDDIKDFTLRDQELTASINAALHREVATPISTPDTVTLAPLAFWQADLEEAAIAHRPLLKQLEGQARSHRAAAALARYERWPDLTLWAAYRFRAPVGADPGTDFFSLGVSVPLPFDFEGQASARKTQMLEMADASGLTYQATLDEIRAGLAASLAAWQRAAEKATLYEKELVPGADTTLKATLTAYGTDRADFASLYQAELQLLEFDRTIVTARVETRLQQVRVESLVGKPPQSGASLGDRPHEE